MATTKGKRWNGNFDTLPAEYLTGVMAKMADYGDRVQFSLTSGGPQPSYQVLNTLGKKMAFDRNHHLLRPEGDEFGSGNVSAILTLEQLTRGISSMSARSSPATRSTRVARSGVAGSRTTAASMEEQHAAQRYAYFKDNRETLPPAISEHTEEIAGLMKQGKSAEEAFGEVIKKYF